MVTCPYCGEANVIVIDESAGANQQYVEDCQVCCQPWTVIVLAGADGEMEVAVQGMGE